MFDVRWTADGCPSDQVRLEASGQQGVTSPTAVTSDCEALSHIPGGCGPIVGCFDEQWRLEAHLRIEGLDPPDLLWPQEENPSSECLPPSNVHGALVVGGGTLTVTCSRTYHDGPALPTTGERAGGPFRYFGLDYP
jgi:hypothetical protein